MNRTILSIAALSLAFAASAQTTQFALKSGDRVVFYGDSITDNGPYTYMVEAFVTTRYPNLDVRFVNAGVGGDRVSGGWMGPIDTRLPRDLFSRKPTVITVMLGMNDAAYRPLDQGIFDTYQSGLRHIVDRIKKEAAGARVYLLQPSPFDDIAQAPGWDPGYNSVLRQYGEFVASLAKSSGYGIVDLNTPLVDVLTNAKADNPDLAKRILPDRVHPSAGGHMVMAEAILKAWGATPLVSSTTIDWISGKATTENATLSGWKAGSFTLAEKALPFPVDRKNAETALVLKSGDFDAALNQETLTVTNMPAGNFSLKIDNVQVGTFSDVDYAKGINLALYDTPMTAQAAHVAGLGNQFGNLRYQRWRQLEFGLANAPAKPLQDAIRANERLEDALRAKARQAAKPVPHKFEITKA